jgi:hypothetical protein
MAFLGVVDPSTNFPSTYYGLEKLDAALSVFKVCGSQTWCDGTDLPIQGSTSYEGTVVLRNLIISNRSVVVKGRLIRGVSAQA